MLLSGIKTKKRSESANISHPSGKHHIQEYKYIFLQHLCIFEKSIIRAPLASIELD